MRADTDAVLVPDGFPGQRMLVVPRPRLREHWAQPGRVGFAVTDCGYFPDAHSHGRSRTRPIAQAVVIACVSGRGWCETEAGRVEVGPGHVIVLEPDRPHAYGADDADPWTVWWVHVAGPGLGDFLRDAGLSNEQPVRTVSDLYPVVTLIAASGAATHLMSILATDRGVPQGTDELVERAAGYLREHLSEPLTVGDLAAMSRLSTSHFAAVFRRRLGSSVRQYQTTVRMARARELLDTTAIPIATVAASVGYPDAFYFSRQFKRIHGVTPRQYRGGAHG